MRVLATQNLFHRTDPDCKDTGPMGAIAMEHGERMSRSEAEKQGYEPCGVCFPDEAAE